MLSFIHEPVLLKVFDKFKSQYSLKDLGQVISESYWAIAGFVSFISSFEYRSYDSKDGSFRHKACVE